MQLTGSMFERGSDGYEEARRATVWNARLPDRYPDLVVQAADAADVVAAVRHAAANGMRIGVRSGGHSWAANHVRDGGMLLDVSRLDEVAVDARRMVATTGPGRKGHELCGMLDEAGLFFPAGHCRGVAVGGYLLQGGYGWNGRLLGPACESVIGIDVVTAEGEEVFADADTNRELFWSARGSGPGFFGVVTRFHLRVYPAPAVCGSSLYVYTVDDLDEIYRWAHAIGPELDRRVEMQIAMSATLPELALERPTIVIASPVFADSEPAAIEALSLLETCPARGRAVMAVPYSPSDLPSWYDIVMHNYPDGRRYAADNMWTHAAIDDLLPGIHHIADTLPPSPSHFLWLNWGPCDERQDMAYSLEDQYYLALYGVWDDPADDEVYAGWPGETMRSMAGHASGIQLADENLGERPARFVSDDHLARLDRARDTFDPAGRFHPWMGRP